MLRDELCGVWRLEGITSRAGKVHTGQTHLVVQPEQLWEVWPDQTYYEGEPGPERAYRFDSGPDGSAQLTVMVPNGEFCFVLRREGDALTMRLGSVFGQFPKGFDDEAGNLYHYVREDDDAAAKLRQPPPRLARTTREHPTHGTFVFDANLDWWKGKVPFGGSTINLSVTGDADATLELIDAGLATVSALDCERLKRYAAQQLLETYNDAWRGGDEGELDAEAFCARLDAKAITVEADEGASVWFADNGLFAGHTVWVSLDAQLEPHDAGF